MFTQTLNALGTYMHGNGVVLLPEMELLLFAIGILVIDRWVKHQEKYCSPALALAGATFSGLTLWMLRTRIFESGDLTGFHQTLIVDSFFLFFAALSLVATALVILLSVNDPTMGGVGRGRYFALLLLACSAMMLMVSAVDLFVVFVALEAAATSSYFLAASPGVSKKPHPSAIKFLLSSAWGSAILAYGLSLLYGLSASTNIIQIAAALARRQNVANVIALSHQPGAHGLQMYQLLQARLPEALYWHPFMLQALPIAAFALLVVGSLVKLKTLPAHYWRKETNSGTPTTVALYLSGAFVIAGMALLMRLLYTIFADSQDTWWYIVAVLAIITLTCGIFASLRESSLERILGYSCVAHVGYLLLGFVPAIDPAITGMPYYLFAYLFMLTGAFSVLIVFRYKGAAGEGLNNLDGLCQRSPVAALLLTVFLLSLAGIPPTAGFLGRYFIVHSLIESRHPYLAWFAGLSALPLAYSYLRIAVHAWRRGKPQSEAAPVSFGVPEAITLGVCVFVCLAAGLYSEPFTRMARYAYGQ